MGMKQKNQKKKIKVQIRVERIGRHFDDHPGFQPKTTPAQISATQYMSQWHEIISGQNVNDVVAAEAGAKTSLYLIIFQKVPLPIHKIFIHF